ncbi:hypothetical protein GEMRC1_003307 [Eukaryota sp. GEM-RC1]
MRPRGVKSKIDTGRSRAEPIVTRNTRKRRAAADTTTPLKKKTADEPQGRKTPEAPSTKPDSTDAESNDLYTLPPRPKLSTIPTWDHKAKLEELKPYASALQSKFLGLVDEHQKIMSDLNSVSEDKSSAFANLEQVKQRLSDAAQTEADLNETISSLNSHIQTLEGELVKTNEEIDNLTAQLSSNRQEMDELSATLQAARDEIARCEDQISLEKSSTESREAEIARLQQALSQAEHQISEHQSKLRSEEIKRRDLHNTILELKGNIRVFVRVRPTLEKEKEDADNECIVSYPENSDSKQLVVTGEARVSVTGERSDRKVHPFTFDHVFADTSSQSDVFNELSELVQSALDGYRVVVFAYGQTGSGKTYTMEGTPDQPGVIPRSVNLLFDTIKERDKIGFESKLYLSTVEIYNETLIDLLKKPEKGTKDLEIKHVDGKTVVAGLSRVEVTSPEHTFELFSVAQEYRRTAATLCNDRSSRSHLIFTLEIDCLDRSSGKSFTGILNLIDLAGSERIVVSGSIDDPERRKEAICINQTLTTLGKCITGLSKRVVTFPLEIVS